MRTTGDAFRRFFWLPTLMVFTIALAACGGGGGDGNTSSNPAGTASVSVSLASAPGFPAGTTLAAPLTEPVPTAKPTVVFDNIVVSVTKLALIPSSGPEFPNPDGEPEQQNASAEEGTNSMPGFVTATIHSPVTIDLSHPPPYGTSLYLCKFDEVPPGEYSKIRVYYDNVVGKPGDVLFHPTANYHFDVHFVGGNLVVPGETSMPGVRAIAVVINVVGLKITQAGNSGNFLMRPQVFSMVESPEGLVFLVHGRAMDVVHSTDTGTFLIQTSEDPGILPILAAYDTDTEWRYIDKTFPIEAWESAGEALGPSGLDNDATVYVTGSFSKDMVLLGDKIGVEFPDSQTGTVLEWNQENTAFILDLPTDNTVFPMPSRESAFYDDNTTTPYSVLVDGFDAIVDNTVKARGYADINNDLEAYWISIVSPNP